MARQDRFGPGEAKGWQGMKGLGCTKPLVVGWGILPIVGQGSLLVAGQGSPIAVVVVRDNSDS